MLFLLKKINFSNFYFFCLFCIKFLPVVGIGYSEMLDALSLNGSSSEFSGFSYVEEIQTVSRAGTSASAKPVSRLLGSKQKLKSVAVRPAVAKGKSSSTSVSKKSSDVNKKSSDTHKKS